MSRHTFTSESVTEGHPDKMADQISDSVLDAVLAEDPYSRVACETMITTGFAVIAGEISTNAHVDIPGLAREAILGIGYTNAEYGIDGKTCGVIVSLDKDAQAALDEDRADLALIIPPDFLDKLKTKEPSVLTILARPDDRARPARERTFRVLGRWREDLKQALGMTREPATYTAIACDLVRAFLRGGRVEAAVAALTDLTGACPVPGSDDGGRFREVMLLSAEVSVYLGDLQGAPVA